MYINYIMKNSDFNRVYQNWDVGTNDGLISRFRSPWYQESHSTVAICLLVKDGETVIMCSHFYSRKSTRAISAFLNDGEGFSRT